MNDRRMTRGEEKTVTNGRFVAGNNQHVQGAHFHKVIIGGREGRQWRQLLLGCTKAFGRKKASLSMAEGDGGTSRDTVVNAEVMLVLMV